jgi:hypothetical protein
MLILYDDRNEMIDHLPRGLKMAELGVFKGEFSEVLLKTRPSCLHLIDIFEGQTTSGDKDGNNVQTVQLEDVYKDLTNKFKEYHHIKLLKGYADKVLLTYEDNFFDFVYIDTSHLYEETKMELEICFKKVKSGGLISGHDYNPHTTPGVVQAVNEFCAEHGLKIIAVTRDILPSFLIRVSK